MQVTRQDPVSQTVQFGRFRKLAQSGHQLPLGIRGLGTR